MISKIIILGAILMSYLNASSDILIYKIANKDHTINAKTVAQGLMKHGYTIAKNQDMNGTYNKQFGTSTFYSYNLMSVYQPSLAKKMVLENETAGIFVPFSVAVYQKNADKNIYVALLSAKAEQNILQTKSNVFSDLQKLNKKTMMSIFPQAKEVALSYDMIQAAGSMYTRYTIESDDEDANDEYEDMMMMMQGSMKTAGFVVANYIDYNAELQADGIEDYTFFHSFSLCKLKIIYELSKKSPEAGAFAPCTMVIYHKKGTNKTEIVSLNINALISMLALKDKEIVTMLENTQKDMVGIIQDAVE
jgi:uncharacterized protein (DUF302 family)